MGSVKTNLILIFACITMLAGCSHDLYEPQPYQTMRLVGDTRATVTFPVRMSDGSVQMVVTTTTLRDGYEAKQLTSAEAAEYEKALAADLIKATTTPTH